MKMIIIIQSFHKCVFYFVVKHKSLYDKARVTTYPKVSEIDDSFDLP